MGLTFKDKNNGLFNKYISLSSNIEETTRKKSHTKYKKRKVEKSEALSEDNKKFLRSLGFKVIV